MACFQTGLTGKSADGTAPADPVTRSLRFDGSAYFSRSTGSTSTTWTLSFWVKRATISGPSQQQYIATWAISGSAGEGIAFRGTADSSNLDKIGFWTGSTQHYSTAVYRDPAAWAHICISVNSGTATVYYNGESILSGMSGIQAWGSMRLGSWLNQNELEGYMADVYGIEGSALDHTSFTESNDYGGLKPKAYTGSFGTNGFHISAQPAHDADLLVTSIDRNNGDTTFADAAQGHGLTVSGDTEHSIAVGNPFTGDDRAIYFDGSSALTMPDSTDWEPSGDFTYEAWIMPTWSSAPAYAYAFGHGSSDGQDVNMGHGVLIKNGTLYLTGSFGSTYHHPNYSSSGSGFAVSANEWTHVAVVRDGNTIRYYKNGVQQSTFTVSGSATAESNVYALGRTGGYGGFYFTGYIADFRITHDAEYPSGTTFTTPTAPHSTTSDTKVRIQPQSSDTTWDDEEGNHTISTVGSPTRKASSPYDAAAKSTAMYFDGSADYIKVWDGSSGDYQFGSNDYTIECWFYSLHQCPQQTASCYHTIFQGYNNTNGHLFERGGVLYYYTGNAGASYVYDQSITDVETNTWHHVAVVRSGNTISIYLDGSLNSSKTRTDGWTEPDSTSSNFFRIGGGAHYHWNGYIYDFRVTGGEAKYSGSTYDTPTAPFELNPVYLGGDQSGNKNHLTPTNISGHDVVLDVPYPKNYATLNPVSDVVVSGSSNTFSNGNLTLNPSSADNKAASTIAVSSGKWYAEVRYDSAGHQMAGIGRVDCLENTTNYIGENSSAFGYVIYRYNGNMYHNSSTTSIFSSISSGDILQIALDLDSNTVWWGKNGTWVGTVGSSGGTSISAGEYYFVQTYRNPCTWNFGQDNTFAGQFTGTPNNAEFAYEIPENFKSLNTSNLDDPTVTPEENFNIALYNGNSSSNAITGLGFQPDILWTKSRSTSGSSPKIFDSIRGVTKRLQPDQATVEQTVTELTSFDSDGFTLGSDSGSNYSGRTYVGWCWKAHQSPTSNTTTYTVKVEDNSGDAWDYSGSYYDSSTYVPSVYMEIFENRQSGGSTSLVSLGKVAVQSYDSSGNPNSDLSEQTYTLECADLNAIAVKWYYDTSGDNDEYDYPNSYNDYLNDQKITILDGTTSEWTTNNYSNDDGTSSNYSPPTGWANGDTLKTATTSYNGSDTATLTSGSSSGPTEKYNAAAGFTIISYSGDGFSDGDSQTLNHSLGVPLDFVIAKPRTNNQSMGGNWVVWHKDLGDYEYLLLNSSSAKKTDYNSNEVIDTATSGSQHQVVVNNGYDGSNYHYLNMGPYSGSAGEDYILYGWAGVEGYSKFGTYKGAGSNGVFVYTGHRPKVVWIKNMDTTGNWFIFDAARDTYNETVKYILANTSNSETTNSGYKIDILSNGFKINVESTHMNNSAYDYVFCSFAESPFKHANAR